MSGLYERLKPMHVGDPPVKPTMLIRDWHTKFTAKFDGIVEYYGT